MAYQKQNFVDGEVLTAAKLNHMEDGIDNAYIKPSNGIPTSDIGNNAITNAKLASGSISREKFAQNALYSPYESVTTKVYNITTNDIGCTLQNSWNSDVTYKITKGNSAQFPIGSELAFLRAGSSASVQISTKDEVVRLGIAGDKLYSGITVKIEDFLGIVAIRKVAADTTAGDLWVVIGNVEVVKEVNS